VATPFPEGISGAVPKRYPMEMSAAISRIGAVEFHRRRIKDNRNMRWEIP
jgi:hypothetical protein